MGFWNSRGLRGSTFEEMINMTNEAYRKKGIALVQKIPTPIKPIKIDNEKRTISLAYFEQKSTVDYVGVVQGIPICFDAKETNLKSLPINNIHDHQIAFMKDFEAQEGMAFILVYFSHYDEYYYIPFKDIYYYYTMAKNGDRKSIPYTDMKKEYKIQNKDGLYLHYLQTLQYYLEAYNK